MLIVVLIGFLSGCVSTYQQYEKGSFWSEFWTGRGEKGGYRDYQIADDQFCVSYIGSKLDSADIALLFCDSKKKIRDLAIKRAAELTNHHRFQYFEILSEKWEEIPGCGTARCFKTVTLQIKCYHDNPPSDALDCLSILMS